VSAQRLLSLLLLLQNGGRMSAGRLADKLEVSTRTVLRDLDRLSTSGVPVYAVRGCRGGFELLDTFDYEVPSLPAGITAPGGRLRRVRVRLSPAALQLALERGAASRPAGLGRGFLPLPVVRRGRAGAAGSRRRRRGAGTSRAAADHGGPRASHR
jgi:biotin operon repressor